MKRRCNKLREKAVRNGLESRAGAAWRIHARSCKDCQTELFVLETLEKQAESQRRHLPRREVALLIEAARQAHTARRRRGWESAWSWSWRLALLGVMAVLLTRVQFGDAKRRSANESAANEAVMLARMPDEASGNYGVSMPALSAIHERAVNRLVRPGGAIYLPAVLPGRSVDRRIRRIRRHIDFRRNTLLEMIDRDLGEGLRQDVWDFRGTCRSLTV